LGKKPCTGARSANSRDRCSTVVHWKQTRSARPSCILLTRRDGSSSGSGGRRLRLRRRGGWLRRCGGRLRRCGGRLRRRSGRGDDLARSWLRREERRREHEGIAALLRLERALHRLVEIEVVSHSLANLMTRGTRAVSTARTLTLKLTLATMSVR